MEKIIKGKTEGFYDESKRKYFDDDGLYYFNCCINEETGLVEGCWVGTELKHIFIYNKKTRVYDRYYSISVENLRRYAREDRVKLAW